MEVPKDYSCEDVAPIPATRVTAEKLDGVPNPARRHNESGGLNLTEFMDKLNNLSKEQQREYALMSFNQHHKEKFSRRNQITYRLYLTYITKGPNGKHERDTYIVQAQTNILRELKAKLPMKGSYRYFFTTVGGGNEEIENEEAPLPYFEKNGNYFIYCRLFPRD